MKRKEKDPICASCLAPKSHHCVFVPIKAPKGCRCDIHDWGDPMNIPEICLNYEECPDILAAQFCKNCEHEKGCHK